MNIRRIVTGRDAQGRSRILSDGPAPRETVARHWPGFVASPLWITDAPPSAVTVTLDPTIAATSFVADAGGAMFLVMTFPPDSAFMSPAFDPQEAPAEVAAAIPGIAETFEPDSPGMHRTPTIDFATVISGSIVLELDDGATAMLHPGDTVVQQGTRHAWRNPGSVPATVSFVMLAVDAAAAG